MKLGEIYKKKTRNALENVSLKKIIKKKTLSSTSKLTGVQRWKKTYKKKDKKR